MKKKHPYQYVRLDNGVQVMAESFDTVQSISIGFFFKSGVLYENPKLIGVSHFIEHMLFKGTSKRSAKEIARQFDRIGGYLNAFTAKDYCCFYARVTKDKLPVAVEILSDMVNDSLFDAAEFERERGVILEEIKMYEDSPDEIIHELLGQNLWMDSPLGRPILGTHATISRLKREEIVDVYQRQYCTGNVMICAAGNVDWDELTALLDKRLKNLRKGSLPQKKVLPRPVFETAVFQKEIEQVHIAFGSAGTRYSDRRRYAITLLNAAFGGGMSSRLFQEIREKRGLAYSVYSYHTAFRDAGLFSIYAGTSLEHFSKVLELVHREIARVKKSGLKKSEIQDTKDQLKGNLLIALESTTNRMNRLVTGFLYDTEPLNPEEAIAPFMSVTMDQVAEVANELFDESRMALTVISPSAEVVELIRKSPFSKRPSRVLPLSGGLARFQRL
ncbi:MAG: insulinase family protein [Candidatus Riflebacteria bacterium]|nr:insulinase family protein [Candidatus Riflebacteria bacterium]